MIKSESSIFTTFRFYYYYFFVGSVSGLFVPVHLLFGPSLRSVPHDYWQWADGTRRMTRGERNPRNRKRLLISYFLRFLWRLLLSSFPSSIRSDRGTEVSEMGMGWVSLRSSHGTVITSERDPPPPAPPPALLWLQNVNRRWACGERAKRSSPNPSTEGNDKGIRSVAWFHRLPHSSANPAGVRLRSRFAHVLLSFSREVSQGEPNRGP